MFFYKIVRTAHDIRLEKYLYSQDRYIIIPLIDPTSPAGKALLNDDYLMLIADASEKVNADLVYIGKEDEAAYRNFINDFCKWADKFTEIKIIKDPMIVIKTPSQWELFIISNLRDDDPSETKNLLWGIINCIATNNASKKIKKYIAAKKLSIYFTKNGEIINSLFQLMQIAVKIFSGNPRNQI